MREIFERQFGHPAEIAESAPGRVNIIGEHTDYNGGFMLPIALPHRTDVLLSRRHDRLVWVRSLDLAASSPLVHYVLGEERRQGGWLDYIQGVTQMARSVRSSVFGCNLLISSTVPIGKGLSSSAALQVSLLRALNRAWHLDLDALSIAKLARLDMIAATQHDTQVASDYARMKSMGMSTVRDAVRWTLIESSDNFDFSSFVPMLAAAEAHDMQVMWTLCHYGWPQDVDVLGPEFPSRFVRFAGAVARYVKNHSSRVPFYTPINEVSFLSWAARDAGWFFPFARGRGIDLKRNLVRAVIAACDAIWAEDRRARIVHVDPVIHVMAPLTRPDLTEAAKQQRASQFEAWDMIAGIRDRELGGHPRYLDVMGVNFYHSNQWEFPDHRLRWEDTPRDKRWVPFHQLLAEVYDRYRRPLFVAETSHFGIGRAAWIREVAAELWDAYGQGIPLEGVCLFPVIDRQDWNDASHWHNSGLWDIVRQPDGTLHRVLNEEYGQEVIRSQALLARCGWGYGTS